MEVRVFVWATTAPVISSAQPFANNLTLLSRPFPILYVRVSSLSLPFVKLVLSDSNVRAQLGMTLAGGVEVGVGGAGHNVMTRVITNYI